ncbi:hypothetical protein BD626DRAFT_35298 [Schizophyllum amplum]|uniref:Uncharacterized protein n=1 Tax=Schizophyllum amplum TaxID=97359 RepID=A0A550CEL0_9AGAR|nr:hypothetical protein BD626DRAFT_35298 [Auriculariopsis ampla]
MPQTPLSGIIFSRGSTLNAGMHAPQSTEEYPISWPVPDLPALFLRSTMSGVYGRLRPPPKVRVIRATVLPPFKMSPPAEPPPVNAVQVSARSRRSHLSHLVAKETSGFSPLTRVQ